jgi:hypothetical protein
MENENEQKKNTAGTAQPGPKTMKNTQQNQTTLNETGLSRLDESSQAALPEKRITTDHSVFLRNPSVAEFRGKNGYKNVMNHIWFEKGMLEWLSDAFVACMQDIPELQSDDWLADVATEEEMQSLTAIILRELAAEVNYSDPKDIVTILDCANHCYSIAVRMLVARAKLIRKYGVAQKPANAEETAA